MRHPRTTEEAQYSLRYPLAAALVRGVIGPAELCTEGFADPEVRRLAARTEIAVAAELDVRFPAERWARVCLRLRDGRRLVSKETPARGDPDSALTDAEILAKFEALSVTAELDRARRTRLSGAVVALRGDGPASALIEAVAPPIDSSPG